jgi:hypothetical protein
MARKASVRKEVDPRDEATDQDDGAFSGADMGPELATAGLIAPWDIETPANVEGVNEAWNIKSKAWETYREGKVKKLRYDAHALWKAMDGWKHVQSDQDWQRVCERAADEYRSGHFFLEQLGAQRYLEPPLFATLWILRDSIIEDMGAQTSIEYMLIDLMLIGYYNTLRMQTWLGNLALETEREFFSETGPTVRFKKYHGRVASDHEAEGLYIERRLSYANHTLLPLLDRCNRMMIRNMRALQELRRGPAATLAIGKADQVNVTQQQVNNVRSGEQLGL